MNSVFSAGVRLIGVFGLTEERDATNIKIFADRN